MEKIPMFLDVGMPCSIKPHWSRRIAICVLICPLNDSFCVMPGKFHLNT